MGKISYSLVLIAGRFFIFMATVIMLLFLANLRSRFYYHGPNYSSLLWMSFYCVLTGIGLLKSKKWAFLLLFLPGICTITIFIYGWAAGARVLKPWALVNYGFIITLVGIPTFMLRYWHESRWL
jgi:hypothetical protein